MYFVLLGFDSLSNIDAAVANYNESWGKTFLYNVFAQSPTEPNFITFSLIRSPNDTKTDEGGFSIGASVFFICIPTGLTVDAFFFWWQVKLTRSIAL